MRIAPDAQEDRAVEVTPIPPPVVKVTPSPDFGLMVAFADGLRGMVDCKRLILGERAGVFAQLRDASVFATAHVELGAVTWQCGLDLAPDAMYDAISRTGSWVLE